MKTLTLIASFLLTPTCAQAALRLVVQHDLPLLRSETRALDVLVKELNRRKLGPVERVDATAAEIAVAAGQAAPASLPPEWKAGDVIVFLQVLPPTGKAPDLISGGLGSVLVFRPPELEPVYAERVTGRSDISLRNEAFVPWLTRWIPATGGQP